MTKIVLFCSAGMSTSLFVQKLVNHAEEIGETIDVKALPIQELDTVLSSDTDIIVLAPQIRFQKDNIQNKTDKPIFIIEMRDYGMMNVASVLPQILELVKK